MMAERQADKHTPPPIIHGAGIPVTLYREMFSHTVEIAVWGVAEYGIIFSGAWNI